MDGLTIIFAGPLGSHKQQVAERVASALNLSRARFGDYIRAEAQERKVSESAESLQMFGQALLDELGARGLCEAVLRRISWQPGQACVLDGVRHEKIVDELRSLMSPMRVVLVFLALDEDVKMRRLLDRGLSTATALHRVEHHSTEIEIPRLRSIADLVLNEGLRSEDNLVRDVCQWVKRLQLGDVGKDVPFGGMNDSPSTSDQQPTREMPAPVRGRLAQVRLQNFKSFVDETVKLAPFTLLVGANASGKSNFLDALRFLKEINSDASFSMLFDGDDRLGGENGSGIRGGVPEAARVGEATFSVEASWQLSPEVDWPVPAKIKLAADGTMALTHLISCRTYPYPRLEAERLAVDGLDELFRTGSVIEGQIEVPWPEVGAELGAPPTKLGTNQSLLWEILGSTVPGSPQVPEDVSYCANALSEALGRIEFLALDLHKMRSYGRVSRTETRMGLDGRNLSGALAWLCRDHMERAALVNWLAELCSPEFQNIDFIEEPSLGDVMAMLVERDGRRISVRSLSDGTLRFLGLLLALRTAESGSIICIEEIENGLHPARLHLLIEYVSAVVRERHIQVIATTHSPGMLRWLSSEALEDVVVFGRTPEHEGTLIRRLGDLEHFHEVLKITGIDALFATGWLERAL